MRADLDKYAQI